MALFRVLGSCLRTRITGFPLRICTRFSGNQSEAFRLNTKARDSLRSIVERYDQLKKTLDSVEINPDQEEISEGRSSTLLIGGLTVEERKKINAELKKITPLAEKVQEMTAKQKELDDLRTLLTAGDEEMAKLARAEIPTCEEELRSIEDNVVHLLVPRDASDDRNAILEVRAGTGGDEASLFAQEMLRMYERFAQRKGWRWELLYVNASEAGGCKEGSALIKGEGVFGRLKFESGVHRVQRIPTTEAAGRIHTSAATVAILPEALDVDVKLDPKDLKIEVMRSRGAGGQSVNKTESAVRLTHIPTGIVVSMQDERSQHQNRNKAMKILQSKVYHLEYQKIQEARAKDRQSQVGSGDRHERIRTYNYVQDRITDHRINVSKFGIESMMDGELVEEFIQDLEKHAAISYVQETFGS
eukprot:TRINITY_DN19700_c0_g1_i3.p1 TRINITY_DN19700_c0_g1~~TRINITY_DN19700_c0_g1_i3.p1  ORF type:complete len:439 (+),score=53.08 TRINITY_DN19700_c0_g1_i3:74-1318(+)